MTYEIFSDSGNQPVDYSRLIERAEAQLSEYRGFQTWINHAQRNSGIMTPGLRRKGNDIGSLVVPVDRSTGEPLLEDSRLIPGAFAKGLLIGELLVGSDLKRQGSRLSRHIAFASELPAPDAPNFADERHQAGQYVMDIGGKGLSLLGEEIPEMVDGWFDKAEPNLTRQRFTKCGLGVALYCTDDFMRQVMAAELEAQVRAFSAEFEEVDWDSLRNFG